MFEVIHIHPTKLVTEITFIRKSTEMHLKGTSVISLEKRENSEQEHFEILGYKTSLQERLTFGSRTRNQVPFHLARDVYSERGNHDPHLCSPRYYERAPEPFLT
jgi:hypothetical protein